MPGHSFNGKQLMQELESTRVPRDKSTSACLAQGARARKRKTVDSIGTGNQASKRQRGSSLKLDVANAAQVMIPARTKWPARPKECFCSDHTPGDKTGTRPQFQKLFKFASDIFVKQWQCSHIGEAKL